MARAARVAASASARGSKRRRSEHEEPRRQQREARQGEGARGARATAPAGVAPGMGSAWASPSRSATVRSQAAAAKARSCVATMAAAPPATRARTIAASCARRGKCMPRVGSSRSSTRGSAARAAASATRSRSPTERSRGCRGPAPGRPSSASRAAPRTPCLVVRHPDGGQSEARLVVGALAQQVPPGILGQQGERGESPFGRDLGDVAIGQHDAPGLGPVQPGQEAHQGGLAAAVGAHQRDRLAPPHLEARAGQHLPAAAPGRQARGRQRDGPGSARNRGRRRLVLAGRRRPRPARRTRSARGR